MAIRTLMQCSALEYDDERWSAALNAAVAKKSASELQRRIMDVMAPQTVAACTTYYCAGHTSKPRITAGRLTDRVVKS